MKRADAFALVRKRGGTPRHGVTKKTAVLVVGEFGWPLLDDGRPSNSLTPAKAYGVPIASERHFLEWVGSARPTSSRRPTRRRSSRRLSGLPREAIEQLTMFGLIEARDGLYGFRDLAAARQVAELLGSGVALSAITKSLHEIRKWLPDAALSNLRLFPQSPDAILVEQMKGRTDKTGQFVLPVGPGRRRSGRPVRAGAGGRRGAATLATAERLYRRVDEDRPGDPAAPFNLGNLLRAGGRSSKPRPPIAPPSRPTRTSPRPGTISPICSTTRADTTEAIAHLERALDADPAYADAMFNLGTALSQRSTSAEAADWWRRYLALDRRSPWAARAQRALKYCEMQIAGSS